MIDLVTNWERIRRELDSLNLFYSAITGRSDEENNFREMGFEEFIQPKFRDPYSEEGLIEARPDFVLLRDDYLGFVEVKSGRNISEGHIEQSKRNSSFSIEGLRDSFSNYLERDVLVSEFDSIFVFHKDFLEECVKNQNCLDSLNEIMEDSVVLQQKEGDVLTFWEESEKTSLEELNEILEEGIQLDEVPKNELMIVDDPELENIIVYLQRRFLDALKDEKEIVMSVNEIYGRFIPKNIRCSRDRVKRAMKFIRKLDGATLKKGKDKYRVKREDVKELMKMPEVLLEEDADDVLEEDGAGLEKFGLELESD